MYLKVLSSSKSEAEKKRDEIRKWLVESPATVQIHPSPGNVIGIDGVVDDSLDAGVIVVKLYNNSIFSRGDMPSGVGLSKPDSWWEQWFPVETIFDSSKDEDLFGNIDDASKNEHSKFTDDNGSPTDEWIEDNVDLKKDI